MNHWRTSRATEIDRKLREDFYRRLKEYGITPEGTDPILAVLFRSFAVQIEDIYREAGEHIPLAVLDELMSGLGMPERRSQPAQTVLRFALPEGREVFEAGTELIGETNSGERLVFATDALLEVSRATIVFAAGYQDGLLQLLSGVELPEEFERAKPSLQPVSARLGPGSAILIAIDLDDSGHLDHHGFYFELVPEAKDLAKHLQREIWCLLDNDGAVTGDGMLRPRQTNGGVRQLQWLQATSDTQPEGRTSVLPGGFYGTRLFIFPSIPDDRRYRSRIPRHYTGPIAQIFGKEANALFSRRRAWIRIALPKQSSKLDDDIVRIVPHCVTASNIEVLNQTLYFNSTGTSVPISQEGGTRKHLVAPISIKGESGLEYIHKSVPSSDEDNGRYRFRKGRVEIEPARMPGGVSDSFANVRVLVSDGSLANSVGAGAISTFLSRVESPLLTLTNITAATGGTDNIPYAQAKHRFAELLMNREQMITHADCETAARSFEPKIRDVKIEPSLRLSLNGLRRIQRVTILLDRESFFDPEIESQVLQRDLQAHLQERALLDIEVRVAVQWL